MTYMQFFREALDIICTNKNLADVIYRLEGLIVIARQHNTIPVLHIESTHQITVRK
jgi:hypothetical protein